MIADLYTDGRSLQAGHSYPLSMSSKARLDGSSLHETRPGGIGIAGEGVGHAVVVNSVVYAPEGWTEVIWTDGLKVAVTGCGRRARSAVLA